jgi:hypothetical protein
MFAVFESADSHTPSSFEFVPNSSLSSQFFTLGAIRVFGVKGHKRADSSHWSEIKIRMGS